MINNIPKEAIIVACDALRSSQSGLKWQLEVSIPNRKADANTKELYERKLKEVEDALAVFEALLNKGDIH